MDCNKLWMEKMRKTPWSRPQGSGFRFWDQRARQLDMQRKWNQEITTRILTWLDLDPGCTVMDVGAGTGALSVPLSKVARHITAVEPSEEMLFFMNKFAREEGATNISCIGKPWEEVRPFEDVDEHDVVIASHSLVMEDLKAALAKMDLLAKRSVHIITSAGAGHDCYQELRKSLHDGEDREGLDYVYPYNILYEMDIYADVEIWNVEYRRPFVCLDDAVELWAGNLGASSPDAKEIIRSYLSRWIVVEDGSYLLNSRSKWALISWTQR
ncbi:MAG: methyltransferase domain-containing protein [Methanotrichaceae archaeon]|nr:methyltransferase domain-containing protein [Methanotrichaceae archaeon]